MKDIIIYHGSTQIVEYPEIRVAKYNKDFYFGFYCTMMPEQARRWATRFTGKGIINEYLYRPNEKLKTLIFPEMTEEWLDFIASCRLGEPHDYDIVEGPMANDTIFNYVQDLAAAQVKFQGLHSGNLLNLKSQRIRSVFIRQKHSQRLNF